MTMIQTFDKAGRLIQEAPAKSKARRYSMFCAATQKQLNGMWTKDAVSGAIGDVSFVFVAPGVSHVILESGQ